MDCPLSTSELGNGTWTLLHSIAAHAPDILSKKQQRYYKDFFETFPLVYPCRQSASNFQQLTLPSLPEFNTRADIAIWLCKAHNKVNKMLGKPEFLCTLKNLDLRWRKGPAECYEEPGDTVEHDLVY